MSVFLNRTFDDGSVLALWHITESDGKSLNEQRLAVNALIDKVFEGRYQLCHGEDGVPSLKYVESSEETHDCTATSHIPESADSFVPLVSVSHTKGWVAVMTNPMKHVGIDIELADRDFTAVGKKAMSDSELARIDGWAEALKNSLSAKADAAPLETPPVLNPRNTVLGLIWCAKEAVYKRLTVPATDFANQIEIESIVPSSTVRAEGKTELGDNPTIVGKITAIFKRGDSGSAKICLEYAVVSGLALVYTI